MKKIRTIFLAAIAILTAVTAAAPVSAYEYSAYFHYVLNKPGGAAAPMPVSYEYDGYINLIEGYEYQKLNSAKGMCVSDSGLIYIADTGNNAVVVMDAEANQVHTIKTAGNTNLKGPEDVFVQADGTIYIADTGNNRIVKFHADYSFDREYVKPDDSSMDQSVSFTPRRVVVSNIGMIYTIAQDSLMTLDQDGNFKGYLGETKSSFSLTRLLMRLFLTDEQLMEAERVVRPSYLNIALGADNFIYATVVNSAQESIRKITAVGNNVYKKQIYGFDSQQKYQCIAVDKRGFITVLDTDRGQLFQFDQDGNNLCGFGGEYTHPFSLPSAIAYSPKGELYVLDAGTNVIQRFSPTEFIQNVQNAIYDYGKGEYDSSKELWQTVMEEDAAYALAHKGMGNAYYKEKKWQQAMEEYELADYAEGYSKAYEKNRTDVSAKYFLWIVLAIFALIIVLFFIIKYLKRGTDSMNNVMLGLKERGKHKNE